jgi:hypothetical protein
MVGLSGAYRATDLGPDVPCLLPSTIQIDSGVHKASYAVSTERESSQACS